MAAFEARTRQSDPWSAHGNVVALNARQARQPLDKRLVQHARLFRQERRRETDVFWLKENAEFLNILEATQPAGTASRVIDTYRDVYDDLPNRLGAFPQYYRFLLSIALDLEDLGLDGDHGARMCHWAALMDLPSAELSDLQRAEARRLLARRGAATQDPALTERLHAFTSRSATFAIPNRKAAYELTHIVFYLSEYGRVDPNLCEKTALSLIYAGLLAYLDQDLDLLAEICIALRYAGHAPAPVWERAVTRGLRAMHAVPETAAEGGNAGHDAYHTYLVGTWMAALEGQAVMPLVLPDGPVRIDQDAPAGRPLPHISMALQDLSSGSWRAAKADILDALSSEDADVLIEAEASTPHFDTFFELLARASRP